MGLSLLISTAAVAAVHVLGGPDHWLPFVALGRAQGWRWHKLLLLTFLGGVGHVGSSIIIGSAGIGLGMLLKHLKAVEEFRGEIAGWLLIAFGTAYALWGIWRAEKREQALSKAEVLATWTVVILLVLGPCEPLIPLMFLAIQSGWGAVLGVCLLFSVVTVAVMLSVVSAVYGGLLLLPVEKLERW
ncbi:MAG TPA: hypothetical protein EYP65_01570, partial [Armatimonadetes bacterium]|nr:hypothetical protein [Armatimonadota bacterium]